MALDFPTSPTNGQVYNNFAWDSTAQVWRPMRTTIEGLGDTTLTSLASGDVLAYDGTAWVNRSAYTYLQTLIYTADGSFAKASYPLAKAMRVRMVGGGGGSGGNNVTSSTQTSVGSGGGGGAYAEFFLSSISGLSATTTVTVGTGGTAGAAAGAGGAGGTTTFGTYSVSGGSGGAAGAAAATNRVIDGAAGGSTYTNIPSNALKVDGGAAEAVWTLGATTPGYAIRGNGGKSFFGRGGLGGSGTTGASAGVAGIAYGAGAAGAVAALSNVTADAGAAGAAGVVILDLYA